MELNKLSSEEIHSAMHLFMCVDRLHHTLIDSAVQSTQIHRTQHMMLSYLARSNKTSSQKEIAEVFRISPAAVTGCMQKLERAGLVSRSTAEMDNRFHNITLTEKGKQLIEKTKHQFDEIERITFEGITPEEWKVLTGCLKKMNDNLSNAGVKDL